MKVKSSVLSGIIGLLILSTPMHANGANPTSETAAEASPKKEAQPDYSDFLATWRLGPGVIAPEVPTSALFVAWGRRAETNKYAFLFDFALQMGSSDYVSNSAFSFNVGVDRYLLPKRIISPFVGTTLGYGASSSTYTSGSKEGQVDEGEGFEMALLGGIEINRHKKTRWYLQGEVIAPLYTFNNVTDTWAPRVGISLGVAYQPARKTVVKPKQPTQTRRAPTQVASEPRSASINKKNCLIDISDPILFGEDQDIYLQTSEHVIDDVAEVLNATPDIRLVEIQGHTDENGPDAYNLDLSRRRVESVMEALVEKGIDRSRLTAVGMGETTPIHKNATTDEQHAENRRVVFQIKDSGGTCSE